MKFRNVLCAAIIAGVSSIASIANAATLTDGNSSVTFDTGNGLVSSWVVDGVNQLTADMSYYRIGGAGGEIPVSLFASASVDQPNSKTATVTYTTSQVEIKVAYSLTGGTAGSKHSDLFKTVTFKNLTASSYNLSYFSYVDADLGGIAGNNTGSLITNASNFILSAHQSGNGWTLDESNAFALASHGEIGPYTTVLGGLQDTNPSTLSDQNGPAGPDDLAFAQQWSLSVSPAFPATFTQLLTINALPEPASLSLLAIGAMALMIRRRR